MTEMGRKGRGNARGKERVRKGLREDRGENGGKESESGRRGREG